MPFRHIPKSGEYLPLSYCFVRVFVKFTLNFFYDRKELPIDFYTYTNVLIYFINYSFQKSNDQNFFLHRTVNLQLPLRCDVDIILQPYTVFVSIDARLD